MCRDLFYHSTFKCGHFYDVRFGQEIHGRGCQGRCPPPREKAYYIQPMSDPCEACQRSYAWIELPDGRWVEMGAWLQEPAQSGRDERRPRQATRRRRRRIRDRTPTPGPSSRQEEQWEEWRNDEEPYLEEDEDPPPPYTP